MAIDQKKQLNNETANIGPKIYISELQRYRYDLYLLTIRDLKM